MTSGIYHILNTVNGKRYVGSSQNIQRRFAKHRYFLNHNKHWNQHLQNAWNKYGAKVFKFEVVEEVLVEQLLDVEQEHLNKASKDMSYNMNFDARRVDWTPEMRAKMSETKKGTIVSDATKKKLADYGIANKDVMMQRSWVGTQKRIDKTIYHFFNPTTSEKFSGTRVDFCRSHGINPANICMLVWGKNKHYKDWILCQ